VTAATSPAPSLSPYAVFRNRSFTLLWIAQLVSTAGSALTSLAAGILVLRVTHSVALVGVMLMATAAPSLLVGLIAGVFVDRWNRKAILVGADLLRSVVVFLIWIYISAVLLLYGVEVTAANARLRRHRPDELQNRHAPIGEPFRPAERDADDIPEGRAQTEAEAPKAERVADADEETLPVGHVDVEQRGWRREERLRQPPGLRRREFPEGQPQADGDEPGSIIVEDFAQAAAARSRESQRRQRDPLWQFGFQLHT